jgi:hypothetical protein
LLSVGGDGDFGRVTEYLRNLLGRKIIPLSTARDKTQS